MLFDPFLNVGLQVQRVEKITERRRVSHKEYTYKIYMFIYISEKKIIFLTLLNCKLAELPDSQSLTQT